MSALRLLNSSGQPTTGFPNQCWPEKPAAYSRAVCQCLPQGLDLVTLNQPSELIPMPEPRIPDFENNLGSPVDQQKTENYLKTLGRSEI